MDREILSDTGASIGSLVYPVRQRRFSLPRAADAAFLLLLCAWPWIGLFGREPWKADEAYSFGLIWSLVHGKSWLVPVLAGEPFMEKPPLFYWAAALSAEWFGGLASPHEAARIAVAFFLCVTLGFLAAAGRALLGFNRGFLTVALFIGSVGLFDKVHILITDVALMSGLSVALFGLVLSERRPTLAGVALGIGTGIAFMSKGLLGLGIPAATVAALALVPEWRSRRRLRCFAIASAVAVPAVLAWPVALYVDSPDLFREWLWVNNLGRFFGFARHGESHALWFYPLTLAWLSFPLWPFALVACLAAWAGKEARDVVLLPAVAFAVTVGTLMSAWQSRAIYALPALLPLSLLAAAGLDHAPQRFVIALQRGSLWLFATMVATLWLAWLALALGVPEAVNLFGQRVPGFSMPIEASTVAIAGAATLLWWIAVKQRPISARNAVCTWTAGLSTAWLVLLTLWLPYLDYGNAYRTVAASLAAALPRDGACVASVGLGESQRAMFDYYAGLITRRLESGADSRACAWLLVQGTPHRPAAAAGTRWHEVWEGARPGDEAEKFHLYRAEATD